MSARRQRPEEALHMAVARFLDVALPADALWWHTPNGGKRTRAEAGKFRAMGVRAGVADLLVLWRGKLLAIELKADGGDLSKGQKDWALRMINAGGSWYEARNLETVVTILDGRGIPLRARPFGLGIARAA